MSCKYKMGGETYNSYSNLVDAILNQKIDLSAYSDTVFKSSQEQVKESLDKLKQKDKAEIIIPTYFNDDGSFGYAEKDGMSTSAFIETPAFINEASVAQWNSENYQAELRKQFQTLNPSASSDEITHLVEVELKNQDVVKTDAECIHRGLSGYYRGIPDEEYHKRFFEGSLLNTESAVKLRDNANSAIGQFIKSSNSIVKNLTLSAKTETGEIIYGHFDNIIIDQGGHVHVINYKVTRTDPENWSINKVQKYKYELALLQRILEANNINTVGISLSIIPIKVNYNSQNQEYAEVSSTTVSNAIEYTTNNGQYSFSSILDVIDKFMPAKIVPRIKSETIQKVDKFLHVPFSSLELSSDGIGQEAMDWIARQWKYKRLIYKCQTAEGVYVVKMSENQAPKYIQSGDIPIKNQEIIDYVTKQLSERNTKNPQVVANLVIAIKSAYTTGQLSFDNIGINLKDSSNFLYRTLNKYFEHTEGDDPKKYKYSWSLLESPELENCNILAFVNNVTKEVDFVSLTQHNLETIPKLRKGSTILGDMYYDDNSAEQLIEHKATFGNLEILRIAAVLNSVLPEISGDFKLGTLATASISGNGDFVSYDASTYISKYWNTFYRKTKAFNSEDVPENNLSKAPVADPIDVLISEYTSVVSELYGNKKQLLQDVGLDELSRVEDLISKRTLIHKMLAKMESNFKLGSNINIITQSANPANRSYGNNTTKIIRLYIRLVHTSNLLDNMIINPSEQKMSTVRAEWISTADVLPNKNIRTVVNLYINTLNDISSDFMKELPKLRAITEQLYSQSGYSKLENSVVGDQVRVYKNMFADGMNLKNPYVDKSLSKAESDFLKQFLFVINKIRAAQHNKIWTYSGLEDPDYIKDLSTKQEMLWCPLIKASTATIRSSRQAWIDDKKRTISSLGEQANDLFESYMSSQDKEIRDKAEANMEYANPFLVGETSQGREYTLGEHTETYFEKNLESILYDFVEKNLVTERFAPMLASIKHYLIELNLYKEQSNTDAFAQAIGYINKYIKSNVYGKSLLESDKVKKAMTVVQQVKRVVTHSMIGFNFIGAGRDFLQGIWENSMRSLNHFQIDISKSSLAKAYEIVVKGSFTNCRTINIINQLCLLYRLSNIDIARIAEGAKSGRGGVANFENIMYSTLRRPDFVNRMVIFVARMVEDGSYNALSVNNGELVYNWRLDDRFKAMQNKNDPDYLLARGRYFAAIDQWNEEHPDRKLGYSDDLILPYSNLEANAIKKVSDSIYGAYDKGVKSFAEFGALGMTFAMFTTWMNGIVNNYFMKPGIYDSRNIKQVQQQDIEGRNLFQDKDGRIITQVEDKYIDLDNNNEYSLDQLSIVYKYIPTVVQGIIYSYGNLFKILGSDGASAAMEYIKNPDNIKNFRKSWSDLAVALAFWLLTKFFLDEKYADLKKKDSGATIPERMIAEWGYKSFTRSYDSFLGPFNVAKWLSQDTQPMVADVPIQWFQSAARYLIPGEKFDITKFFTHTIAPFRAIQDSYFQYEAMEKELTK